jgi:hypothetical protein
MEALRHVVEARGRYAFWDHWLVRWLPGAKTRRHLALIDIEHWEMRGLECWHEQLLEEG